MMSIAYWLMSHCLCDLRQDGDDDDYKSGISIINHQLVSSIIERGRDTLFDFKYSLCLIDCMI